MLRVGEVSRVGRGDDSYGENPRNGDPRHFSAFSLVSSDARDSASAGSFRPASGIQSPAEVLDEPPQVMDARAYQREMLDKSLKENVIVSMDTGSGKTLIALLRIRIELERCSPEKIVWFLAPTVLLCSQQHEAIRKQIPSATTKLLTGNEGVETWTESVWTPILSDARVVVSTPQVLCDALHHGFVRLERLALLVFDEVHNCVKKDAGGKIMDEYYHPLKRKGQDVPAILGLTASPSMTSKLVDMEKLEVRLNARCMTPTLHRQELIKRVKKPRICHIDYDPPAQPKSTKAMESLRQAYHGLDIRDDPYILKLLTDMTDRNKRLLVSAIEKNNTYTQNQMKGLYSRSLGIARELGIWAADRYIWRVRTEFLEQIEASDEFFDKWSNEEKLYLGIALRKVEVSQPSPEPSNLSKKANLLIDELCSAPDNPACIIFAKERSTVNVLYELLSACPRISERFRVGTVVGASSHTNKKRNIYELLSNTDHDLSLQKFRSGHINLLIATSVLEEGIDIPACNLVICFDELHSFKSFVQRRGRARMKDSKLVLFFQTSSDITKQWQAMEAEMRRQYEDEERERHEMELLEEDERSQIVFEVESTGAKLGFDEAKQHLEHFCRALSQGEFVDSRPDYIVHRDFGTSTAKVTATVLLPTFLPPHVRQADSRYEWKSEKSATKDAAFHAYIALYREGLVNDNLLPFKPDQIPGVEEPRAPIADIEPPYQPWKSVTQAWKSGDLKWVYRFTLFDENDGALGEYDITLPVRIEQPRPIRIHKDYETLWELRATSGRVIAETESEEMLDHTSTLLALHFGHRWTVHDKQHVIKITAVDAQLSRDQLTSLDLKDHLNAAEKQECLVRDHTGTPFLYQGMLPSKPPIELVRSPFNDYALAPDDVPYVILKKWTKRADFLHRLLTNPGDQPESAKPYGWVSPLPWAKLDDVSVRHAQFGMLIPSIIHELGVMLLTRNLADTLLEPVGISDLSLVREAVSAGSAVEPYKYERLELLGDSILKYCASILAASVHPEWPEGYLSFFKDRLVSNTRLQRACIESGLAKYILTKPFTGHKWRPLYLEETLKEKDASKSEQKLSTKTLADVVEALIGAAYHDGGIDKACKCIAAFLQEQEWPSMEECQQRLFKFQPAAHTHPAFLEPMETLIGYTFKNKSFAMEALTHASFVTSGTQRSLERLEFLGDAVLDNIIVTRAFAQDPPLTHDKLHLVKTAMVNADFLAFVSCESSFVVEEITVNDDQEVVTTKIAKHLWAFMRHGSTSIANEQTVTAQRYKDLRERICNALETGSHYPWALLASLQARKFFSDLVEALLGAVWIDSGSLDTCRHVLEKLGIMPYLERILRDQVEVMHPKELLGKYAVNEAVKYETSWKERTNGEREYACKVHIGERLVAEVDDGVSKDEVRIKAATEAVRILEDEVGGMDLD